jgi:iron complex transport system substrate-binding protein
LRSFFKNSRGRGFFIDKQMIKRFLTLTLFFILLVHSPAFSSPRYISLAPSTTEILFALGLDEEIVGVSQYCNYPPQALTKEKVGSFSQPNIEKIISLKPDIIFSTGLEQAPIVNELRRLKFNVYVGDPATIEQLLNSISEIGKIVRREEAAAELIKKMKNDIGQVTIKAKLIPNDKKVKVFVEIWHEPMMTAGKGSFIDEMISLAGGINVAHDTIRPFSNFSAEKVIALNPQIIILAYMDKELPLNLLEGRFGWKDIEAVREKRVFNDINPDLLLRPGPRITEGLKELHKKMYP